MNQHPIRSGCYWGLGAGYIASLVELGLGSWTPASVVFFVVCTVGLCATLVEHALDS